MTMRRRKRKPTTTSPYARGVVLQWMKATRWGGLLAAALVGIHLTAGLPLFDDDHASAAELTVWKSSSCDCCGKWIEHMRAAGFSVLVHDTEDVRSVKIAHGVPESLWSCHTAVLNGYVIEGHVPAEDVRRLQAEPSGDQGLAVPGMPASAPGMDQPGQPYQVVTFGPNGSGIYANH